MQNNKFFSNKQYGFINRRSTTLKLLNLMEEWTKMADDGVEIHAIYMDFMKAFDTVPHRRLIYKLKHYKICEPLFLCTENVLSGRYQKVIINNTSSDMKPVTSGIPQGSVRGPSFSQYI